MQVYNPATGQVVAEVPVMGAEETGQAIAAAHEAFKTWSKTTAKERSKLLKNLCVGVPESTHKRQLIVTSNKSYLKIVKTLERRLHLLLVLRWWPW